MPMDVEYCVNCLCSEFELTLPVHECTHDCEEECPLEGEYDEDAEPVCSCGCIDTEWIDNPFEPTCLVCGCGQDDGHHDQHVDSDGERHPAGCGDCGDCTGWVLGPTVLERLRRELEDDTEIDLPPPSPSFEVVRVDWFDEPLTVVGAVVADVGGLPERVTGVPPEGARVFLWFAEAPDGTELAISRNDLVR